MYNSQIVKERINDTIKKNKTSATKVLADCELSPNTINQMSDNKGLSSFSLAKIADYLNVSVDYLLGRTDEPQKINYGVENHGDNNGAINNQVNSTNTSDGISKEMLVKFEELNFTDKVKVMSLIAELSQKE